MRLKLALLENKKKVDEFLTEYLDEKKSEAEKFDSELSDQVEILKTQILRGGKRLRPFVMRLASKISGVEDEDLIVGLGSAVEILHQYFLIHDDIVDRDEKRYGDLSLHKMIGKRANDEYMGISLGIILGNYANSLVYDVVLSLDISEEKKVKIFEIIYKTIRDTVAGWQIHYFQNKIPIWQASEERYLTGMELVSAKYTFETPMLLGAEISNNNDLLEKFKRYAYSVGMAFQIRDDILGVFGDTSKTGKPSGNDLREGKKTLLILKAYKNGTNEQKKYIKDNLGTEIEQRQLDEMRDIITQTGSLSYSENIAASFIKEAKSILDSLNKESKEVDLLRNLADFVLHREK